MATPTPKPKKVLILSCHMGQGHMSAAKAIKAGVEQLYKKELSAEIVDLVEILSPLVNRVAQKTYDRLARGPLFKILFKTMDKKWRMKLLNRLNYRFALKKIDKLFTEKKPDIVISTWPVWDYIVLKILKKQQLKCKFISIITDSIMVHNAWVIADADYHIVPNTDTAESAHALGVKSKKIKTLGFPVRLDFLKKTDRQSFLKKLKLNPKNFTVLFLPTVQKTSKNLTIMKELLKAKDRNIIIITGRDKKITPKFARYKNRKNIKIMGWTDQMPDFIKSADIVITKAGGATVMECIAAQKPIIITSTIARHEAGNAELIKRYKVGIIAKSRRPKLDQNILTIQKNYSKFRKNLKKIANPGAALKIAEFINEIVSQTSAAKKRRAKT